MAGNVKDFGRYLAAAAGVILAGLVIMDQVAMPAYVSFGTQRVVPDVRGSSYEEAERRLRAEGFAAVRGGTEVSDRHAAGTVMDQYPVARKRVKPGRRIRLTVAEPAKMITVPELSGKSLRNARLQLEELGLVIDSVSSDHDLEVPRDVIKEQRPRSGAFLRKGSGVDVVLSLGRPPDYFQVPQLFGLSLKKAEEALGKARLSLGHVSYRQAEDLLPYTVLEQAPPSGAILIEPEAVDVTVSIVNLQDIRNRLTGPE